MNEKASKETLNQADCDEFRVYYQHLEMFSKCVVISVLNVKKSLEIAESKIFAKVEKIKKEILESLKDPKTVAEKIVEAAFYANNLYIFQHIIKKQIDDILDAYKTQMDKLE